MLGLITENCHASNIKRIKKEECNDLKGWLSTGGGAGETKSEILETLVWAFFKGLSQGGTGVDPNQTRARGGCMGLKLNSPVLQEYP